MHRPPLQIPRRAVRRVERSRACRFEQVEGRTYLSGNSIALWDASPAGPSELPAGDLGSLSGRVVETADGRAAGLASGVPIPGVAIRLLDEQGALLNEGRTDADGRFHFANLSPGVYALQEIQPAGFASGVTLPGSGGGQRLADNLLGEIVVDPGANWTNYTFYEFAASPTPPGSTPGVEPTGSNATPPNATPIGAPAGGFWITSPYASESQRRELPPAASQLWQAPSPSATTLRLDPRHEADPLRQVANDVVRRPASEEPIELIDFSQFETPRLEEDASISAWLAEREQGREADDRHVEESEPARRRQPSATQPRDRQFAQERSEAVALAHAQQQQQAPPSAPLAWDDAQQRLRGTTDDGADAIAGSNPANQASSSANVERANPTESPDDPRTSPRRMSAIIPRRAAARLQ